MSSELQSRRFYAHSTEDPTRRTWQALSDHLTATGSLAGSFAEAFGGEALARASGLLHDLGKYTDEFQNRIAGSGERVDHSTWGARVALERYNLIGHVLAYGIAGHHAGLANGVDGNKRTSLSDRLASQLPVLRDAWRTELVLPDLSELVMPKGFQRKTARLQFQQAFLTRMVFSCLVDADFLDTERFYARVAGIDVERDSPTPSLGELRRELDEHLKGFSADTPINTLRAQILAHARSQANQLPGLFSLTVPTGGGKTLTSLAFALDHALKHGLRRIIFVIPFTSIVEQTAAVFRRALGALGERAVLEHHSTFLPPDVPRDDPDRYRSTRKLTLAMENWDAPIVVTTAVQFLESLFADRPAASRKLHRTTSSVIVLDEAQTLPIKLMRPTLAALDELVTNYRSSIVLCTATQPALGRDEGMPDGLTGIRELAPNPSELHCTLRRTRVRHLGQIGDETLAQHLAHHSQVLCIVNNRRHARALFLMLEDQIGARHLTTLMCAAHRRQVLDGIRADLKTGRPCRVISTSLIEAGVDVDFPTVLRTEAGLDSIAQAAGRCNREGRRPVEHSEVMIFQVADDRWAPPPELRQFAQVTRSVLRRHAADPLAPSAIRDYFQELFWQRGANELDGHGLLDLLRASRLNSLPFETLAERYRVIESLQRPVLIPFDETAREAIGALRHSQMPRSQRLLQAYVVPLPHAGFEALRRIGAIAPAAPERFGDQFMVLTREDLYDQHTGLNWEDSGFLAAESLCW